MREHGKIIRNMVKGNRFTKIKCNLSKDSSKRI